MPTHVALLRGINLGPHKRVAMPALRALVAGLGHTDVATYIASGNVVFTGARNGDLAAVSYDWTVDHKERALASLEQLRQPEFCGGCHQQFVPGTGLIAIGTLDEYHASSYAGQRKCVDCHMPAIQTEGVPGAMVHAHTFRFISPAMTATLRKVRFNMELSAIHDSRSSPSMS